MVGTPYYFNENASDISPDIPEELETRQGELHLRFYLSSGDEFALPATGIREVMQQEPERITPIPNASPLLLGTINLRGQIIWVADLGQFLGDLSTLNTEKQELLVIAIEDQEIILGLAIDRINSMEWLDVEELQMSTNLSDNIAPFVQGEWILEKEENKPLKLLDHLAILRSARWGA